MNKLYLSGSIVPALIAAGLACLIIAYAAAAAAAPMARSNQPHAQNGHGWTKKANHRQYQYAPRKRPSRIAVAPPRRVANGPPPRVVKAPPRRAVRVPPRRITVVPPRRRYGNIWIVRPYGHRYYGYGYYRHDRQAYRWLGLTAITVASLNHLTEAQQREHEAAQVAATTAPVGEVIHWKNGGITGSVTSVNEGHTDTGRYCREFLQEVTIGGKTEQAYGTACQQPDGAWEVIP